MFRIFTTSLILLSLSASASKSTESPALKNCLKKVGAAATKTAVNLGLKTSGVLGGPQIEGIKIYKAKKLEIYSITSAPFAAQDGMYSGSGLHAHARLTKTSCDILTLNVNIGTAQKLGIDLDNPDEIVDAH